MPNKIQAYKIESGSLDASGEATAYSTAIRGKILAVEIDYPANTCTVDITREGIVDEKILNLAAASTDTVKRPRAPLDDNTGTALDPSDTEGGNTAVYGYFEVHGRLKLEIASGTQEDTVTVRVLVEEY